MGVVKVKGSWAVGKGDGGLLASWFARERKSKGCGRCWVHGGVETLCVLPSGARAWPCWSARLSARAMGAGLALGWGPARRPVVCGDPTGATGGKGGHPSTLESHGLKGAMLSGDHKRERQETCV